MSSYWALRRAVVDVLDSEVGDDVVALRRMLADALEADPGDSRSAADWGTAPVPRPLPYDEAMRALAHCQHIALFDYPRLRTATRRMLIALDHYWAAYEYDGGRMELWWNAFERERGRVEAVMEAGGTREAGNPPTPESDSPSRVSPGGGTEQ